MQKKSVAAVAAAAALSAVSVAAFAHGGHHEESGHFEHGENGFVYQHEMQEANQELEFDSIYGDLNENKKLDPEEITPDNLRVDSEARRSYFEKTPIAKALNLGRGQLLLTIDDGPNPAVTRPILKLLKKYNIKATFFVVGSLVERNAGLIREMVAEGHTIGNHTYTHDVPNITQNTIVREVTRAYDALVRALGHEPSGRLLFRAPGLGWSAPKAVNLNADRLTRRFIGPIHANIGTDAPQADWACWSKGVSSRSCADFYYNQLASVGRGIVLTHDIFYRPGRGNTAEMLEILLDRLEREGGGIRNLDGSGFWEFVTLDKNSYLDTLEADADRNPEKVETLPSAPTAPSAPSAPVERTADGYELVRSFAKPIAFVRTGVMLQEGAITENSQMVGANGEKLRAGALTAVADLGKTVTVEQTVYKLVRIEGAQKGFEHFVGQEVYIWEEAFFKR